uniref:F-box associated beta-propeller type 3 domain-containing protein n=1 Tax=Oryza punctata TaxID=4537 RepID=A0A0E0M1V5_ORYPU
MNHEMMMYNPSTRQIVFLPKVNGNLCTGTRARFGFDSHSNKYKFEVLTLGTNAWRQTEDPPYPIDALTPVHVKGAIYWIVFSSLCPDPPNAFLRLCLIDEKFSLFPCPPSNVNETLALEIWNCSGGQTPEWTRRCVIQITPDVVMKYPVERPPLIVFVKKCCCWHSKRSTVSGVLVMAMIKRCSDIQVSSTRPRKAMRIAINSWSRILLRYIPEDVMFTSLCKAWHAMISSSRFVNAHLECSKQRPSMLMILGSFEMQKNGENIAFLMNLYKYQDPNIMHMQDFPRGICKWIRSVHCDGLLLISTRGRKHKMMICNPLTRDIVSLPEGSRNLCGGMGLGFGFDPHSNKYKVCKFEVLTLGTDAWRQTQDPPYPTDRLTPVHVKGAIYWTLEAGTGDLDLQCWQNPEWTRCCTIQIPPDLVMEHFVEIPPLVVFHGRRLLLASNKVYLYDIQTCKLEKIASTFEDFTCYDPTNGAYQTFLKKAVMDLHLFNYADSLVAAHSAICSSISSSSRHSPSCCCYTYELEACNFKGTDS